MKKLLPLLTALPLLLNSCATITNKKQQKLSVYSNKPGSKAEINDTTYNLPATVKVTRSKEDLKVRLITDSISKEYTVKASPNAAFVYGNLIFSIGSPAAYAVDLTSDKRFYYGHKIDLNDNDTITTIVPALARGYSNYYNRKYPAEKAQINITGGIPVANFFYFKPRNEDVQKTAGFLGISLGIEYYYRDNKFLKLNGSYAIDNFLPVPIGVEHFDAYEKVRAANVTLTDNFKLNRFTIGYGLNYAVYTWQLINSNYIFPPAIPAENTYSDNLRPPLKKNSHAFGLSLNAYHQITKGLFAGINYNPTFITTFPAAKREYQHLIGLEVTYKLRLQ